jgi:hypothetical protein
LHDEPGDGFLVLGVDFGCFGEFALDFIDAFFIIPDAQVDD